MGCYWLANKVKSRCQLTENLVLFSHLPLPTADGSGKMSDKTTHTEDSVEVCDVSVRHTEDNTHLCFEHWTLFSPPF